MAALFKASILIIVLGCEHKDTRHNAQTPIVRIVTDPLAYKRGTIETIKAKVNEYDGKD